MLPRDPARAREAPAPGQLHLPDQVEREARPRPRGPDSPSTSPTRHHRVRAQAPVLQRLDVRPGGAEGREPLEWLKGRRSSPSAGSPPGELREVPEDLGALLVGRERFLDHYRYEPRTCRSSTTTPSASARSASSRREGRGAHPRRWRQPAAGVLPAPRNRDHPGARTSTRPWADLLPQNALAARNFRRYWRDAMIIDPRFEKLAED